MKAICLITWMIISLIFVCSIIGLVMFIPKDSWEKYENTPSTWYSIGKKLLDSVVK
jgi:cytochrome b subunit of formate dehydrogenase